LAWAERVERSVIRLDQKLGSIGGIKGLRGASNNAHKTEKKNGDDFDLREAMHADGISSTMH